MAQVPETTGNPWRCAACGRPETDTGPLQTTPRAFRKPALLCAKCRHRSDRTGGVALWILLITPAALAWLSPFFAPESVRLDVIQRVGGIYLFESVFVLLHELGHALAGHLAGFRIEQVRLGYGALVYARRLFGIEWQVRLLPYGGLCFGIPRNGAPGRTATSAFILGGPAVNAILLGIGLGLLALETPDASSWWEALQIPWLLAVCNGWLLAWSMLPIAIDVGGRVQPNDSLLLLQIWFGKNEGKLESFSGESATRRTVGRFLHRIASAVLQGLGVLVIIGGCGLIALFFRGPAPPQFLMAPLVFFVCGGLLLTVGRSLVTPRLRAARDLSATSPDAKIVSARLTDQRNLTDGYSKISEIQSLALRNETRREQGRAAEALDAVRHLLVKHPQSLFLNEMEASLLGQLGRTDEAGTAIGRALAIPGISEATRAILVYECFKLLASAGRTKEAAALATLEAGRIREPVVRSFLLDSLASMPLLAGHGEFLEQADGWSAEALVLDPSPTVRATRGGVLYELGRIDEAEPLLRGVVEESKAAVDLGIANLYLALIANLRGNKKAARKLAWIAFNHYPDRRLVERLASDGLASA